MGFGLLMIGYIFTFIMSITHYGYIPRIIGYVIMIVALEKLYPFKKTFKYTQYSLIPLIFVAAYQGVTDILPKINIDIQSVISDNILEITTVGFTIIFHILLLLSIYYIANDTGLAKIKNSAVRNIIIISLYACLFIFMKIPISFTAEYMRYFSLNSLVLQLLWTVLNIFLILSCAKNICPEGEEEITRKPSRFEFINNFHEKMEQRDKKAKEEMLEYKKQKLLKKNDKRKHK